MNEHSQEALPVTIDPETGLPVVEVGIFTQSSEDLGHEDREAIVETPGN